MSLLATRAVSYIIEQPLNSLLYHLTEIKTAINATSAMRVCTVLAAYGAPTLKPLELWGTAPCILSLHRKKPAKAIKGTTPATKKLYKVTKRIDKDKNSTGNRTGWMKDGWVTGTTRSDVGDQKATMK